MRIEVITHVSLVCILRKMLAIGVLIILCSAVPFCLWIHVQKAVRRETLSKAQDVSQEAMALDNHVAQIAIDNEGHHMERAGGQDGIEQFANEWTVR
jgi:hypothetical protein